MARNPLIDLAARWARDHIATDHHADERIARTEWEAGQEAQRQLGQVLLPGLHRRNEQAAAERAAARADAERTRRAAMAPSVGGTLRITGDVSVVLDDVLVEAEVEDDILHLLVEPAVPGGRFRRLALVVVGYAGPGDHDLRDVDEDERDPLGDVLVVDDEAEPFWPDLEHGPCRIHVTGNAVDLDIAWADAASRRVRLVGRLRVALPQV